MEASVRTCNITTEDQNRRLRMGVVAFALTLVAAVVMLKLQLAPGWRLLLVFPFFVAANGLFMGLYKA